MNRVLKNFLSTSVANIIGQLVGFICITYYSAILQKDNYGMITFAQQFVLYFTTIVLFGIQTFGTKLVVKKEKNYEDELCTCNCNALSRSSILCDWAYVWNTSP